MSSCSKPIYFKGCNSILSNFKQGWLFDDYTSRFYNSVEQWYQYTCAKENGYTRLADKMLQVPFQNDCGSICKQLAKGIGRKTDMWREGKANIIYEMMKVKFNQCKSFRDVLMATTRPLIHPVSSLYWGTGHNGLGQNMCGQLLMDLRQSQIKEWGKVTTEVAVFTDSILSHLPVQLEEVGFTVYSLPGGSVGGKKRIGTFVDDKLQSFHQIVSPDAVVLHVGTNDLQDIASNPQLLEARTRRHVSIVDRLLQYYDNKTVVLVSSVLPRIDCPDLAEWSVYYNLRLNQHLSKLGKRVRFVDWSAYPQFSENYLKDGMHPSDEAGMPFIHWKLVGHIKYHCSAQRDTTEQMIAAMEVRHLTLKRRQHLIKKKSRQSKLNHHQHKSHDEDFEYYSKNYISFIPKPPQKIQMHRCQNEASSVNSSFQLSSVSGRHIIEIANGVQVAIKPHAFIRPTSKDIRPTQTLPPKRKRCIQQNQPPKPRVSCIDCSAHFSDNFSFLDHFVVQHSAPHSPTDIRRQSFLSTTKKISPYLCGGGNNQENNDNLIDQLNENLSIYKRNSSVKYIRVILENKSKRYRIKAKFNNRKENSKYFSFKSCSQADALSHLQSFVSDDSLCKWFKSQDPNFVPNETTPLLPATIPDNDLLLSDNLVNKSDQVQVNTSQLIATENNICSKTSKDILTEHTVSEISDIESTEAIENDPKFDKIDNNKTKLVISEPLVNENPIVSDLPEHIIDNIIYTNNNSVINEQTDKITAIPVLFNSSNISVNAAIDILSNLEDFQISYVPPVKPKGGEIYIISTGGDKSKLNDWRCDQYKWGIHNGIRQFSQNNAKISKVYHKIDRANTFQRTAWWFIDNPHIVLVQYLGDHTEFESKPHGNSKSEPKHHYRTCPSVISNIKEKAFDNEVPINKYRRFINNQASKNCVLKPKNLTQVINTTQHTKAQAKLSHDDYYNLLLVSNELEDYVFEVKCYPDLMCFFGLKEILSEFSKLIELSDQSPDVQLYCSYDTTYNLGDFYLSILVFRHGLFENNPVFPLAFMIHERKFQNYHEDFLTNLIRKIPNFKNAKVPIIVDKEAALTNAIHNIVKNVPILQCWNHIKNDFKFWLRKQGALHEEVQIYESDLNILLNSDCPVDLEENLTKLSAKWSEPVLTHFNTYIKPGILKYSGKWILKELKLYNSYSGVTNNISESMNLVIKRLQKWKEAPVDTMVLVLYYLQTYYWNEILRGFCNLGNYRLREQFQYLVQDPSEIDFPKNICEPDKIIEQCKSQLISSVDQNKMVNKALVQNETVGDKLVKSKQPSVLNLSCMSNTNLDNDKDQTIPLIQNQHIDSNNITQAALAHAVIREKRIVHVPEMGGFMVEGSRGDKYAVSLYPKESCQCPSSSMCYHILAVKLSIGAHEDKKKKTINMRQLARNKRKLADKKSGRKKPRKHDLDYTVVPAPDSVLMNKSNISTTSQNLNMDKTDLNLTFSPAKSEFDISGLSCLNISNNQFEKTPLKPILKTPTTVRKRKSLRFVDQSFQKETENLLLPSFSSVTSTPKRNIAAKKSLKLDLVEEKGFNDKIYTASNTLIELTNTITSQTRAPGSENHEAVKSWVRDLDLQITDLKILNKNGDWLNNNIINAALKILSNQFPNVPGLQCCDKIPIFSDVDKRWHYAFPFDKIKYGAQIHFDGNCHWFTTIKPNLDSSVYILDSAGNVKLSHSSQIQIAQLYFSYMSKSNVIFSKVQPQNAGDCGVHAIANLVEFCFDQQYIGNDNTYFIKHLMRSHCVKCIENQKFEPFPRKERVGKTKLDPGNFKTFSIKTNCKCGLPDFYENMIQCENINCNKWYHYSCADVFKTPNETFNWCCDDCNK